MGETSVRRQGEGGRRKGVAILLTLFILSPSSFLLTGARQDRDPTQDADALYRAVRENLTRSERAAHRYAYKERRTDIHRNPFGRIGTDGLRVFEVYPSANRELTYRRLVGRDGVPLDQAEIEEQDHEYEAKVDDLLERAARRTEDERRERQEEAARARRRAEDRVEDVINTLQFTVDGRTIRDGVAAIAVAFTPNPEARPETREGRLAQKFSGTIWIDEAAAEVMRIEATSIDSISFGLGLLARVSEGATATLTRRPVDDNVWMPTEVTLNGRGRAVLFFRRLVIEYRLEWFDYQPLKGDSLTPFFD